MVAGIGQRFGHRQPHRRHVLDDQHMLAVSLQVKPTLAQHGHGCLCAGRQHQRHFGALPHHAAEHHVAAGLAGEAVDCRQPKAGALADGFGGEERVEHLVQQLRFDAGAVVAHADHHIGAVGQVGVFLGPDGSRVQPDPPALGQRVTGVDHQVEHRAFQLHRVDQGDDRLGGEVQGQRDALANGAGQQFFERAHVAVDVHGPGVQRLLAREGQ